MIKSIPNTWISSACSARSAAWRTQGGGSAPLPSRCHLGPLDFLSTSWQPFVPILGFNPFSCGPCLAFKSNGDAIVSGENPGNVPGCQGCRSQVGPIGRTWEAHLGAVQHARRRHRLLGIAIAVAQRGASDERGGHGALERNGQIMGVVACACASAATPVQLHRYYLLR